jgi:hypothetical protein
MRRSSLDVFLLKPQNIKLQKKKAGLATGLFSFHLG